MIDNERQCTPDIEGALPLSNYNYIYNYKEKQKDIQKVRQIQKEK